MPIQFFHRNDFCKEVALASAAASSALLLLSSCASAPEPMQHAEGTSAKAAQIPAAKTSDEANQDLLRLAREQGETYRKALDYMIHQQAVDGGEQRVGDYIVAYAIETAEGYYQKDGDQLRYHRTENSTEENAHVEISVRDGNDQRFVPGLDIKATLTDDKGKSLGTKQEVFMWHPWLYHYGENWRVPKTGTYTLKIEIAAPGFRRHDQMNGNRFTKPVVVEFKNVRIQRGVK